MAGKIVHSRNRKKLLNSLKKRGLIKTLLVVTASFSEFLFDLRYKIDTYYWVELDNLGVEENKLEHAVMYQQTHSLPLKKLLKHIKIPEGKVFVDLGCGKGKALIISSKFGFREVRGVEFSPLLCDIARKNCLIYKEREKSKVKFSIIESDVREYLLEDDEDVFYLFNPFDEYILKEVIQNILNSIRRRKRKIWVIYHNPLHREIIEQNLNHTKCLDYVFRGYEFSVFEVENVEPSKDNSFNIDIDC